MEETGDDVQAVQNEETDYYHLSNLLLGERSDESVTVESVAVESSDGSVTIQLGVLKSLELVHSTAQLREDNRICIWPEDVWSDR